MSKISKEEKEKSSQELHVPGHNFNGPGTNLYDRFDLSFDGSPDFFLPVNKLDRIAMEHDLLYYASDVVGKLLADRKYIADVYAIDINQQTAGSGTKLMSLTAIEGQRTKREFVIITRYLAKQSFLEKSLKLLQMSSDEGVEEVIQEAIAESGNLEKFNKLSLENAKVMQRYDEYLESIGSFAPDGSFVRMSTSKGGGTGGEQYRQFFAEWKRYMASVNSIYGTSHPIPKIKQSNLNKIFTPDKIDTPDIDTKQVSEMAEVRPDVPGNIINLIKTKGVRDAILRNTRNMLNLEPMAKGFRLPPLTLASLEDASKTYDNLFELAMANGVPRDRLERIDNLIDTQVVSRRNRSSGSMSLTDLAIITEADDMDARFEGITKQLAKEKAADIEEKKRGPRGPKKTDDDVMDIIAGMWNDGERPSQADVARAAHVSTATAARVKKQWDSLSPNEQDNRIISAVLGMSADEEEEFSEDSSSAAPTPAAPTPAAPTPAAPTAAAPTAAAPTAAAQSKESARGELVALEKRARLLHARLLTSAAGSAARTRFIAEFESLQKRSDELRGILASAESKTPEAKVEVGVPVGPGDVDPLDSFVLPPPPATPAPAAPKAAAPTAAPTAAAPTEAKLPFITRPVDIPVEKPPAEELVKIAGTTSQNFLVDGATNPTEELVNALMRRSPAEKRQQLVNLINFLTPTDQTGGLGTPKTNPLLKGNLERDRRQFEGADMFKNSYNNTVLGNTNNLYMKQRFDKKIMGERIGSDLRAPVVRDELMKKFEATIPNQTQTRAERSEFKPARNPPSDYFKQSPYEPGFIPQAYQGYPKSRTYRDYWDNQNYFGNA